MHNLAFWDLKDSKVNSHFKFGVVSSSNDKVTTILRFLRKRWNSRERKPRKGQTRGWRLSTRSAELIRSFMCMGIGKHQTSLQIIAKVTFLSCNALICIMSSKDKNLDYLCSKWTSIIEGEGAKKLICALKPKKLERKRKERKRKKRKTKEN